MEKYDSNVVGKLKSPDAVSLSAYISGKSTKALNPPASNENTANCTDVMINFLKLLSDFSICNDIKYITINRHIIMEI